ncbi:MAG: hypothetical protein GY858_09520 [Candidatus Omnitrophica bacterium]|nr:hypothetical protein [Candidatus Omnitrophota bacterium]
MDKKVYPKKQTRRSGSMKPIAGFHLVRFGTAADQKFLLGSLLATYDQLIVNANIMAYMTSAIAMFISTKAKNKPYIIDPQTHAFQHDLSLIESQSEKSKGQIKKSIKKLIDAFGEPVETSILNKKRPLIPKDFKDSSVTRGFCQRVINFQLETVSRELEGSDAAKYYRYIGLKVSDMFSPTTIVAPYFYLFESEFKKWLQVNVMCSKISKKILKAKKKPLASQIVISQDILIDNEKIDMLVEEYAKVKPDIFLLWVDDLYEQDASAIKLEALINLINRLGQIAPVANLYGGFFSVALGKSGITPNLVGVAHSLEYGEYRGVVPVGGGFPAAKFYFPQLHTRLLFRDALRALRAVGGSKTITGYYKTVCSCKMCKDIIKNNPESEFKEYGEMKHSAKGKPYPATETKNKTVTHYMWCKKREYHNTPTIKEIVRNLNKTKGTLEKVLGPDGVRHCIVWAKVLNQHFKLK